MNDLQITIPAARIEWVVGEILGNCPECCTGLTCVRWKYDLWEFVFVDEEDGKRYMMNKARLLAAFPLMYSDKWPKGLRPPPTVDTDEAWDTWLCQSDAWSFDAFIQLACLGEVIYG